MAPTKYPELTLESRVKFLCDDGISQYARYNYRNSLPYANGLPGPWQRVTGRLVRCKRGFHTTNIAYALDWMNDALYAVEEDSRFLSLESADKNTVRAFRFLYRIETWNDATRRALSADLIELVANMFANQLTLATSDSAVVEKHLAPVRNAVALAREWPADSRVGSIRCRTVRNETTDWERRSFGTGHYHLAAAARVLVQSALGTISPGRLHDIVTNLLCSRFGPGQCLYKRTVTAMLLDYLRGDKVPQNPTPDDPAV